MSADVMVDLCGTYGGYQTHKRRGETPCDDCKAASAEYMREYRAKNPAYYQWERRYNRAADRARRRLARTYQSDYLQLLDEELGGEPR